LNLDRSVFTLDPGFEPTAIIRQRAIEILQRNLMQSVSSMNLIGGAVELKEFAEKLPGPRQQDSGHDRQQRVQSGY
jgi:hypothetical protein